MEDAHPIVVRALNNALDFIESALENISDDGKLAFAVVHLHIGIETLLKVRIVFEDWKSIVRSKEEASALAFEMGDFSSIGFDATLKKARSLGIRVSNQTTVALDALADERNRIVHFAPCRAETLRSHIVAALEIVWTALVDGGLIRRLDDDGRERVAELHRRIKSRPDFVAHQVANPSAGSLVLTCPSCLHRTARFGETGFTCVCGVLLNAPQERQWLAARYWIFLESPLRTSVGSPVGAAPCPICRADSVLIQLVSADTAAERELLCMGCGRSWRRDAFADCECCPSIVLKNTPDDCISCELYPEQSNRSERA